MPETVTIVGCGCCGSSSSSSCTGCGCPGGLPDTLYASGTCNVTLAGSDASGNWSGTCTINGCLVTVCVVRNTQNCCCCCNDYSIFLNCNGCDGLPTPIACVEDIGSGDCCGFGACSCSPIAIHFVCCSANMPCCSPNSNLGDICIAITT